MNKKYYLIIAGAGAAGLAAAINAAQLHPGQRILLLERMPRAGKKILATGNGRCNLSNRFALNHCYTNRPFALEALEKYDVERTLDFFAGIGLLTYTDSAGRIYPLSNTAASVLDALRFAATERGVEIKSDCKLEDIRRNGSGFLINGEFEAEKLILACGGKAARAQGSDGSGYSLAESLGHSVTELSPSLVQLCSPDRELRRLKGVRVHDASISACGESFRGEILFTDYGLSGIAAMELSRFIQPEGKCEICIDLLPSMSAGEIEKFLCSFDSCAENMLTGLLPKSVGLLILQRAGIPCDIRSKSLSGAELQGTAREIKHFKVTADGTRGFDNAQVTRGGVRTDEFNSGTLESKLIPNLYCAGELLDVDGGCGGFNLQWAWSSGLLCGELG